MASDKVRPLSCSSSSSAKKASRSINLRNPKKWILLPFNLLMTSGFSMNTPSSFLISLLKHFLGRPPIDLSAFFPLHLLPPSMLECFRIQAHLVLWNQEDNTCSSLKNRGAHLKMTTEGKRFVVLPLPGKYLSFFPDISPVPIDNITKKPLNFEPTSPWRIFDRKIFTDSPNVFLFPLQFQRSFLDSFVLVMVTEAVTGNNFEKCFKNGKVSEEKFFY